MTQTRILFGIVIAALAWGLAFRLYPVVAGQPVLSELFITEDGYLMLTVARNIAIGLGMTVSDGTIPTNGVQPLATFLFSVPYFLTGGDKVISLMGIHLILAAVSVAAVFAIRALAARLLCDRQAEAGAILPWVVATLWFLGPVLLRHSMNGLETGLITLVTVATLLQFGRVIGKGAEAGLADRLGLGLMCGLVFLARIDAALLCVMIFAVWALDLLIRQRVGFVTMLAWLVPAGVLSLLIAAPWLLNNLLNFGSLMPISGTAQSLTARFGANVSVLPPDAFELFFPMLPLPLRLERMSAVIVLTAIVTALILILYVVKVIRSGDPVIRAVVAAYLLHAIALAVYYGLFFGAPHFVSRYLAPLAPLFIIAATSVALDMGRWLLPRWPRTLALGYGIGGIVLSSALLLVLVGPRAPEQGHAQVVAWVEDNVPDETWVGAVQTGTLGYWHDRTINLDGKVNPEALEARRTLGHVLYYVADSEIDYIADWAGLSEWLERPQREFADAFEVIVDDRARNLSVLRRRGAVP